MDPTTFDALAERSARQTSRRAALASLIGGGLLLLGSTASDATRRARRRRRRRRRQRHRNTLPGLLKPISVLVRNPGLSPVTVQHGFWLPRLTVDLECTAGAPVQIPPGESRPRCQRPAD